MNEGKGTEASTIASKLRDYQQLMKFTLSFTVVFSSVISYLLVPGISFDIPSVLLLFVGGLLVTGAANAFVVESTSVQSAVPMQLATYASNGARDTAIVSPVEGMMIYVTGSGMQVRGATQWNVVAGSGT